MARIVMWIMAVANLGYMIWVVLDPNTGARYMGVVANEPSGYVELRAMYAGLIGGLGFINLAGALKPERLPSALWASACLLGSVGIVRGASCLWHGIGGAHIAFAFLELAAASVCVGLLKAARRAGVASGHSA